MARKSATEVKIDFLVREVKNFVMKLNVLELILTKVKVLSGYY